MSHPTIILVVDDNPSMANTMADILSVKGFEVYAAVSGKDALEVMSAHPVDILLTDVKMPDMDGVTLYRQTRKTYPNIVTFLMTAYAADELIQKGMAEGIKTVLTKPLDIDFVITLFSAYRNQWTSSP
jgi:CheY-like chemotaxis protein